MKRRKGKKKVKLCDSYTEEKIYIMWITKLLQDLS